MAVVEEVLTPAMLAEGTPGLTEARLLEMITDAWALAVNIAPCIESDKFAKIGVLRSILRRAIYYDAAAAAGRRVVQSQTVGPISQSFAVNKPSSVMFSPSQEASLAALCASPHTSMMASLQFEGPDALIGRRRYGV